MDISLPQNIMDILNKKVEEGLFNTLEEAVNFAVNFAFIENNISVERIKSINEEIEKGWQEMEEGKGRNSKDVFQDLRKKYA